MSWCLLLWDLNFFICNRILFILCFILRWHSFLQNISMYPHFIWFFLVCLLACIWHTISRNIFLKKQAKNNIHVSNADWRHLNLFRHVKKSQSKEHFLMCLLISFHKSALVCLTKMEKILFYSKWLFKLEICCCCAT